METIPYYTSVPESAILECAVLDALFDELIPVHQGMADIFNSLDPVVEFYTSDYHFPYLVCDLTKTKPLVDIQYPYVKFRADQLCYEYMGESFEEASHFTCRALHLGMHENIYNLAPEEQKEMAVIHAAVGKKSCFTKRDWEEFGFLSHDPYTTFMLAYNLPPDIDSDHEEV